jgi:hypothetical protein
MSKRKAIRSGTRSRSSQPSAFTTIKSVEEAAAEAIAGRLSNYHRNFHGSGPLLGGLSSFGSIYLSGDESKRWEGNEKTISPGAEEMANYRERLLTDSPTGPSFSTARRERSEDLSHIRETLNPGVPGQP